MKTAAEISEEIRKAERRQTQKEIVESATELMYAKALRSKTVDIKYDQLEAILEEDLKKAGFNIYSSKTGKLIIVVP